MAVAREPAADRRPCNRLTGGDLLFLIGVRSSLRNCRHDY
jgi:hypothetical protein